MADRNHIDILRSGKDVWNSWREDNPDIRPDLESAQLVGMDLSEFNLSNVKLREANLSTARLCKANLTLAYLPYSRCINTDFTDVKAKKVHFGNSTLDGAIFNNADLSDAKITDARFIRTKCRGANISFSRLTSTDFTESNFVAANFSQANFDSAIFNGALLNASNLTGANLCNVNLRWSNLTNAILKNSIVKGCDLSQAMLLNTDFSGADISGCTIYGAAVWNVRTDDRTKQQNLQITDPGSSAIFVDNLEVGQFIYLLLANEKIRDVIDTITSKMVLILGRFTKERKCVLDTLRATFKNRDYVPVIFDFERPTNRSLTETICTLANMSKFVIADITDAKCIPQELSFIVPSAPSIPVQPIIHNKDYEYSMFEHFKRYPWVLPVYKYASEDDLLQNLNSRVIIPLEQKLRDLSKSNRGTQI